MRVAAIDCGTNSIRLLVTDVPDTGAHTDLLRRMEVVRLGQGVDATGRLAPEAIERTVAVLREWLAGHLPNVHPVGRNGMHRYNNQDHSMLTAMLAVENILGLGPHDVWSVNVEGEYLEESSGAEGRGTGRDAPVLARNSIQRGPGA